MSGATPILLSDVATIQVGPEMRRGIAELDGEGEMVSGVIVTVVMFGLMYLSTYSWDHLYHPSSSGSA